jgi:hypothetical protein
MLVLKHVEYEIIDAAQLDGLLAHLMETTSRVNGITLKDVYFMKDKKEFVLFLDCDGEECYHEWREICPPPPGARDWHEVLLDREEHLSKK